MPAWDQDKYIRAWHFASGAHNGQRMPGSELPYIVHLGNVAMEIMAAISRNCAVDDPDLAVQCALLHDVIEDTGVSYAQLTAEFGSAVADGVSALSKNPGLPDKDQRMLDSLERIRLQPHEVWMVKLADRITNLQAPPRHWTRDKTARYRREAVTIYQALGEADDFLASRLKHKIDDYSRFL